MKENSIEEDIARIAKLITTKFNNDYSIDNRDKEALEHILSDYKRTLKENEQLRTELNSLWIKGVKINERRRKRNCKKIWKIIFKGF